MGGGSEKRLIDEHPMCQSSSRTFGLGGEHEDSSGWVRIKKGVGRNCTLRVWHVVAHESHGGIVPNRRQFIFAFGEDFIQVGNIVKVKCHFRVESFDTKEDV